MDSLRTIQARLLGSPQTVLKQNGQLQTHVTDSLSWEGAGKIRSTWITLESENLKKKTFTSYRKQILMRRISRRKKKNVVILWTPFPGFRDGRGDEPYELVRWGLNLCYGQVDSSFRAVDLEAARSPGQVRPNDQRIKNCQYEYDLGPPFSSLGTFTKLKSLAGG